jgi:photosystem II stability/assembly factor-like uncharacterized protein
MKEKLYFSILFTFLFLTDCCGQIGWLQVASISDTNEFYSNLYFPSQDSGFLVLSDNYVDDFLALGTSNAGLSWNESIVAHRVLYPRFQNENLRYLFSIDSFGIGRSIDSGKTWTESILTDSNDISISGWDFVTPANSFLCGDYASSGEIVKSIDSGITWRKIFSISNTRFKSIKFQDTLNGLLLLHRLEPFAGEQIWATSDGGVTWILRKDNILGLGMGLLHFSGSNIWRCWTRDRIMLSSDDGISWQDIIVLDALNVNDYLGAVSFYNDSIGYGITAKGFIFKTEDGGRTWYQQKVPQSFNNVKRGVDIIAVSEKVAYADNTRIIIKTEDGGGPPLNSVKNIFDNSEFVLKGNPIVSSADFQFVSLKSSESFELFDLLGRQILHKEIPAGESSLHIDMQSYPAGVYFARLGGETIRFAKM